MIAQGIKKVVDIALEINQHRAGQIKYIDIGGGYGCCIHNYYEKKRFQLHKYCCPYLSYSGLLTVYLIFNRLPVNFATEEVSPTFVEYSAVLKQHIPVLFTDEFTVLTEFGRTYNAKVCSYNHRYRRISMLFFLAKSRVSLLCKS